jgi:hypothetical protein
MGAVCAVVYLLSLIIFIPFAFYKDIVAATSGGGNRDVVIEDQHIEMGRYLHRFPHGKVCFMVMILRRCAELISLIACIIPVRSAVFAMHCHPWDR